MKTFNVFVGPHHRVEAVKEGWSWPGFFFGWIWCFVKGLPVLGVGLLALTLILNLAFPDSLAMAGIASAVSIGVAVWLGASGNDLVERKLKNEGFQFATTIQASNPDHAEALFRDSPVEPPNPEILEPIR